MTEKPKAKKPTVAALIAERLADADLSYAQIAEQVREAAPGAKTSARSVASTAARLRKAGTPVPQRALKITD